MSKHETVKIWTGSEAVEVDKEIYLLVQILNEHGIKTKASCQGDTRGYIAIDLKNVEIFIGQTNGEPQRAVNLRFPTPTEQGGST